MTAKGDLNICRNHASHVTYRGDVCPWCAFEQDAVLKLQAEYKRGFEDGVMAADRDHAKKEAANVKRSNDNMQQTTINTAVPGDIHREHQGGVEPDDSGRQQFVSDGAGSTSSSTKQP